MSLPPPLVRRLLIGPLFVAVVALLMCASPLLFGLAAVCSVVIRSRAPLRVTALALSYLGRDALATAAGFGLWVRSGFGLTLGSRSMRRQHYDLMDWFLAGLTAAAERTMRLRVEVEESQAAETVLRACGRPAIVLSRHAGVGDSFLLVDRLLVRYGRRPRIVLKAALQLDPFIDMFGNRLPNYFIDDSATDCAGDIGRLAEGLESSEAVLIFPEGGNFSAQRQERAVEHLEKEGHPEDAARARELENLLPPQPDGTLAALAGAREADVVFVAHTGLPELSSVGELWSEVPLPRAVRLRLWLVPSSEVPATEEERREWLFGWWERVDEWIEAQDA